MSGIPAHRPQLEIQVYPRLHVTLLAMNARGYRINGGFGFAVSAPTCTLFFCTSRSFTINDLRLIPFEQSAKNRLFIALQDEKKRHGFAHAIDITIQGEMATHSGFGSGTAITLACLEALHHVNNSMPPQNKLVSNSGRGGTSGIGIHTYFSGGCVLDLGRRSNGQLLAPSHQVSKSVAPLLLGQVNMPNWDIGICIPKSITLKTQAEEHAFFMRVCPLSTASVYKTIYHTLFGLYAAVQEGDRQTFCEALRVIQQCAWKSAERQEYGERLASIEKTIYSCGADAIGMSSLGPGLFFLANDVMAVISKLYELNLDCQFLHTTPVNHGRTIRDIS